VFVINWEAVVAGMAALVMAPVCASLIGKEGLVIRVHLVQIVLQIGTDPLQEVHAIRTVRQMSIAVAMGLATLLDNVHVTSFGMAQNVTLIVTLSITQI
jgi:hypothetical protein